VCVAIACDDAQGKYTGTDMLDDSDIERISKIPTTQPHRDVDFEIETADTEGPSLILSTSSPWRKADWYGFSSGYLRSLIIAPGLVFGTSKNSLTEAGIANATGMASHLGYNVGKARGQAWVLEEGKNEWAIVDVKECKCDSPTCPSREF
jgi:hypothetical protein